MDGTILRKIKEGHWNIYPFQGLYSQTRHFEAYNVYPRARASVGSCPEEAQAAEAV